MAAYRGSSGGGHNRPVGHVGLTVDAEYQRWMGAATRRQQLASQGDGEGNLDATEDLLATSMLGRKFLRRHNGTELLPSTFRRWLATDVASNAVDYQNRAGSYVEIFQNVHGARFTLFFDFDVKGRGVTEEWIYECAEMVMRTVSECTPVSVDISGLQAVICTTVNSEGDFQPYRETHLACPFCEGEVGVSPGGRTKTCGNCASTWNLNALTRETFIDQYGPNVTPIAGERNSVPKEKVVLKSGFHVRVHGARVTYQQAITMALAVRQNAAGLSGNFSMQEINDMVDFAPYRGSNPSLRFIYTKKGAQCPTCFGAGTVAMDGRGAVQCITCFGAKRIVLDKAYSILDVGYFTTSDRPNAGKWLSAMVEEEDTGAPAALIDLPRPSMPSTLDPATATAQEAAAALQFMSPDRGARVHSTVPPFQRRMRRPGPSSSSSSSSSYSSSYNSSYNSSSRGSGAASPPVPLHLLPEAEQAQMSKEARVRAGAAGAGAEWRRRCRPVTVEDFEENLLLASIADPPGHAVSMALQFPADLPFDHLDHDQQAATAVEKRRRKANPHLRNMTRNDEYEERQAVRKTPVARDFYATIKEILVGVCPLLRDCKVSRAVYMDASRKVICVSVQGRHSNYCFNKAAHNPAHDAAASNSANSSGEGPGTMDGALPGDYHTTSRLYAIIRPEGVSFKCRSIRPLCEHWQGTRPRPLLSEHLEYVFGIADLACTSIVDDMTMLHRFEFLRRKFGKGRPQDRGALRNYLHGLKATCGILNKYAVHNTYTDNVTIWSVPKMLKHFDKLKDDQQATLTDWVTVRRLSPEEHAAKIKRHVKPTSTRDQKSKRENSFAPPNYVMAKRGLAAMQRHMNAPARPDDVTEALRAINDLQKFMDHKRARTIAAGCRASSSSRERLDSDGDKEGEEGEEGEEVVGLGRSFNGP
jgi:hypothetical protein